MITFSHCSEEGNGLKSEVHMILLDMCGVESQNPKGLALAPCSSGSKYEGGDKKQGAHQSNHGGIPWRRRWQCRVFF
jgi:hypothetical protein